MVSTAVQRLGAPARLEPLQQLRACVARGKGQTTVLTPSAEARIAFHSVINHTLHACRPHHPAYKAMAPLASCSNNIAPTLLHDGQVGRKVGVEDVVKAQGALRSHHLPR